MLTIATNAYLSDLQAATMKVVQQIELFASGV
jgi:hypothetical protein